MKKSLGIVILSLLIAGCQSPEEKAFNNCIEDIKGKRYNGTVLNEFAASIVCQEFKKQMPELFRISKGKLLEYLSSQGYVK
ncbi:hypothetical protein OAW70_00360 [Candidatus Pelagibacter ubique]|nr:hypothetical protein [Candidatus Pelagibacter ubique]